MLRRSTRVQLVIFALITLVGVSYVGAKYVGLTKGLFGAVGCTVRADFPDSGGIYTNAEVTYRGVTVGQVGKLRLIDHGVRADLKLTNCDDPKIPASSVAIVSDRSVIGEQYVNLVPPNGDGPFLSSGQIIPMSRNKLPVPTHIMMLNLDRLVRSVDLGDLRTTVDELGEAFNGNGPALGSLLDSTNVLLTAAQENLPATVALIDAGNRVLSTQLEEGPALASFTKSLRLLTGQFKASDTDIRRLLDQSPGDLSVLRSFVTDNRTDLGVTLANLATTGELLVQRKDGLEQILELYPALAAGGTTVTKTGYSVLGVVLNYNDPPDCGDPAKGGEGYDATVHRLPSDQSPQVPNTAAHCTAAASSGTNVRGSANVPGGDPVYTGGGGVAYPRATTENTVQVGDTRGSAAAFGDASWLAMLTGSLN